MFVKAIHTLQRAADAKPAVVYSGQVVELIDDELEHVLSVGAAVEATDDEIAAVGFAKAVESKPKSAKAASQPKAVPQPEDAKVAQPEAGSGQSSETDDASKKGGESKIAEALV